MNDDQSEQLLNLLAAQLDVLNRIARALQTIAVSETYADRLPAEVKPTPVIDGWGRVIGGDHAK